MLILGIDPGQTNSGCVLYDTVAEMTVFAGHLDNFEVLGMLRGVGFIQPDEVAIEDIESMGLNVGKSTFDTCAWRGRFQEAWENFSSTSAVIVGRGDEKIVLCGTKTFIDPKTNKRRAITNSHIRRSLLELFPAKGGGKCPQVGTKSKPGPLYGVSGDHCWSAMAVIATALITKFQWREHGRDV